MQICRLAPSSVTTSTASKTTTEIANEVSKNNQMTMTRTNETEENSNETVENSNEIDTTFITFTATTTATVTTTTATTTTTTEHIIEDSLNETDSANQMEIPSFFKESCIEGQECCKDKVLGM